MEFEEIGKHCKVCRQKDFLPFDCDRCGNSFCKDHRTYKDHSCPGKVIDNVIFVCSHCKKEATVPHHCKASSMPKCPVPGCKVKMTSINSLVCKRCNTKYCISHRYEDRHHCAGLSVQPVSRNTIKVH